jgi:hypothetical protein
MPEGVEGAGAYCCMASRLGIYDCHLSRPTCGAIYGAGSAEGSDGSGSLVVVSLVSVGHWLLGLLGLGLSSTLGLFVSNAVTLLHAVGLGVWLLLHDYLEGRREVGIRADGWWSLVGGLENEGFGQEDGDGRWNLLGNAPKFERGKWGLMERGGRLALTQEVKAFWPALFKWASGRAARLRRLLQSK